MVLNAPIFTSVRAVLTKLNLTIGTQQGGSHQDWQCWKTRHQDTIKAPLVLNIVESKNSTLNVQKIWFRDWGTYFCSQDCDSSMITSVSSLQVIGKLLKIPSFWEKGQSNLIAIWLKDVIGLASIPFEACDVVAHRPCFETEPFYHFCSPKFT